ncbi:hypothetical protein KAX17_09985 [Candidatus Bipolaricaulota bacterium]|nr:hypothetical protein [Candidatus Bipolaricaulota bacterium]
MVFNRLRRTKRGTLLFYLAIVVVIAGGMVYLGRYVINQPWSARDWIAATAVKDKIYVLGGQDRRRGLLDEVMELNLTRHTLRVISHLPSPACCLACVTLDGHIYALGGQGEKGYLDQVVEIDPQTKDVRIIAALPTPRTYGAAAATSGKLYYVGGWDGKKRLDEIVEIDPKTGETTIVGHLPSPREFLAAAGQGDRLYVLGGEDEQWSVLDEVLEFQATSWKLVRIGYLLSSLTRTAAAVLDEDLFLLGGWSRELLDEIVKVKITDQGITSEVVAHLPEPAADRAAVSALGKLYFIGGIDPGFKRQIAVLEINPQSWELKALRFRGTWLP